MFKKDQFSKFNPPKISTENWTSRKSHGRFLKIHPLQTNPSKKSTYKNFSDLVQSNSLEIVESLKNINIIKPTTIQEKAIPVVASGENVLFAAETGSGKTWTYLIPIIENVLKNRESKPELEKNGPEAIILVPTRELCEQTKSMGEKVNLPVKFVSLGSNFDKVKQSDFNQAFPDVVIATPPSLISALFTGRYNFNHVRQIVIDECDTLFDESFYTAVLRCLRQFNIQNGLSRPLPVKHTCQLIMCGATIPTSSQSHLSSILDVEEMRIVKTGYLHRVSTHISHHFLRVKPSEKLNLLLKEVENKNPKDKIIIFCNQTNTCKAICKLAFQNGILISRCDGTISPKSRQSVLNSFLSGDIDVLVTTDLLSRGINTPDVSHVINYNVPNHLSDYLHRSGRVGRVDSDPKLKPKVTTFVSKRYEIEIVAKIEDAVRRRNELNEVDANIKQQHRLRWEKKKL